MRFDKSIGLVVFLFLIGTVFYGLEPSKIYAKKSEDSWEPTIRAANDIQNRVQTHYADSGRDTFVIRNLDMELSHRLTDAGGKLVSSFKPSGRDDAYATDTMDVVVEDREGGVYRASLSDTAARINMYRLGLYYTDVHVLDTNLRREDAEAHTFEYASFKFDGGTQGWVGNSYVSPVTVVEGALHTTIISAIDPNVTITNTNIDIGTANTIEIRMKYTGSGGGAKLFYGTADAPGFAEARSKVFALIDDGEFHTYKVNMASERWKSPLTDLRLDIDGATVGSELFIDSIKMIDDSKAILPVQLERVFHVYPDKLYQEIILHTTGNMEIRDAYLETNVPSKRSTVLEIRDGNGVRRNTTGMDPSTVEYVGVDSGSAGIFGYIYPNVSGNGTITVERQESAISIKHHADIGQGTWTKGQQIHIGSRIYNSLSRGMDSLSKEADLERDPLGPDRITVINSDAVTGFEGYNPFRGFYSFTVDHSDFNQAFYREPHKHPSANIRISNGDRPRRVYAQVHTKVPSGALEAAALLDENGKLLPVPVEVAKNFQGENEEPFYSPGDTAFSESYFPLELAKRQTVQFTSLHMYQNWGKYPLKQVSSVSFTRPYYHLSTGVTETNCWVPFFTGGRTGWILPDFRARSGNMWSNQPQFDSVGKNYFIEYRDVEGKRSMMENTKARIDSAGPTHSDVTYDFVTDDGKADVKIRSVEMPQTDENRTFVTLEMTFRDTVEIQNTADNFSLFRTESRGQTFRKLGYLDGQNEPAARDILQNANGETLPLGNRFPYWTLFDFDKTNSSGGGANIGVLVQKSDIVIGGRPYEDGLAVVTKRSGSGSSIVNTATMTLARPNVVFRKGDRIKLDLILLPWGTYLSKTDETMRNLRADYGIGNLALHVENGVKVGDMIPTVRAKHERAEFTLSGGKNNIVFAVEGFDSYVPPNVYKFANGQWEPVDSSVKGYDGYRAYVDREGTYGFAFVVESDGSGQRYKVEAKERGLPAIAKEWSFKSEGDPEGWQAQGGATVSVSEGALRVGSTGSSSFIESDGNLSIRSPIYRYVKLNLKNHSSGSTVKLHFVTNSDRSWSEDKSIAFPILAHAGAFTEYTVDMSAHPKWKGQIEQLRLYPPDIPGSIDIDYIRVTDEPSSDTAPPSPVSDLSVAGVSPDSATLSWTAPGDDLAVGKAAFYDIRYSTVPVTESNWTVTSQVYGGPAPGIAGTRETFTITGLNENTRYYFAVKAVDDKANVSVMSNVAEGATPERPAFINSWEFERDGDYEGWAMQNQVKGTVANGFLKLTATGSDPYIVSQDKLAITDPSAYRYVRLRLKNQTASNAGQIFFITNEDPIWSAAKYVPFTIKANDSEFTEYIVDMGTNALWKGTIKAIRVDPVSAAGTVEVDYIRIGR
ncbi:fibronectin type III domain-containing protein [Paenibacillus sp. MBLB4367]|uniref:fibronectin type III domain-containing protein n=1 Tax=Paenibacillus sp. MBLB4367 TaxID=3384767 RepID=UPI0039080C74